MRFVFDDEKAAQAAAHLIRRHGGRIDYTVLPELLYLADRRALIETGYPITGDRMVSMPHGPVLSATYDRIGQGATSSGGQWPEWLSHPTRYEVALRRDPGGDRLSPCDIAILDALHEEYGHLEWRALRDLTHGLPEYEDPHGSSLPIRPERILESAGRTAGEIERIRADAEHVWTLHRALGSAPAA